MIRKMIILGLAVGALAFAPSSAAAADPVQDAIGKAVAWLHTKQLADGSFGGASVTADAVYALVLSGEDLAAEDWTKNEQTALDGLALVAPDYVCPSPSRQCNDAGRAGRVARAVALAGGDPRSFGGMDLVAIIQSRYDAATGRYQSGTTLYGHTLAVEGLLRSGVAVPDAALSTLFRAQLPDGGWFWSFSGTVSDIDSTGLVMQLLAGNAGVRCASAYPRVTSFLVAAQLSSGGWGVYPQPNINPPNANSTALAVGGLRAIGVDPDGPPFQKSGRGALHRLLGFQESSGAFVYIQQKGKEESRLMATLDSLTALARPLAPPAVCRPVYLPSLLRMP